MVRDALGKVMWVGRATVFCVGLAVVLALVIGTASVALAAVPGDPFKLGQVNSINRLSTLVGNTTGPMLRVQNKGTGSAADLRVQAGKPPMTVNSTGRVPRLNADMVDGKHASAFLPAGGKAADADKLDGVDSAAFWRGGTYTLHKSVSGTANSGKSATHACHTGDKLLSGGYYMSGTGFEVFGDIPYHHENTYYLYWRSDGTADNATLYVHCADF